MRSLIGVLLVIGTWTVAIGNALGAIEVGPSCQVPEDVLANPTRLLHVGAARRADKPIRILMIGTTSSAGAGNYPARLEALLRAEWGSTAVAIVNKAEGGQTAEKMAERLPQWLQEARPDLLLWQTGTVDAMRGVDLDTFGAALARGIRLAAQANADVILISPQYGSGALRLRPIDSYLDYLYQIARADDVLLFRRHRIMRYWVENDQINFSGRGRAEQARVAEQVHDCLARLLAVLITTHLP